MIDKRIQKINELYKKSQKEELTEDEKVEQINLRKGVASNIRSNVNNLLNTVYIENEHGIVENLVQKYGNISRRDKKI